MLIFREFSKEKERVENRNAFLKERAAAAEAEKYENWVDKGEEVKVQEDLNKCKKYILLKCVESLRVKSKTFQLDLSFLFFPLYKKQFRLDNSS